MKRAHASPGFTLLEVTVAMAILGIAFAALFGQISTSLSGIPRVERAATLVDHARFKLAELQLAPVVLPNQQASGRFDDGAEWRIETTPFAAPGPSDPGQVVRISLTVAAEGRSATFVVYRFELPAGPSPPSLGEQLDAVRLR